MIEEVNEDEFVLCGCEYQAKTVRLENGCSGCAIFTPNKGCAANMFPDGCVPNCDPGFRKDGRNVIFVEKQK